MGTAESSLKLTSGFFAATFGRLDGRGLLCRLGVGRAWKPQGWQLWVVLPPNSDWG